MTVSLDAAPRLDHLVVLADTLGQGVAWCEATLGVTPGPGGEHPLFGTHNRLLSVAAAAFPLAYLEIIAINNEAASAGTAGATGRKRWFDMDDEALRRDVRQHGPRLIHRAAHVPHLAVPKATRPALQTPRGRGHPLVVNRTAPTRRTRP